MIIKVGIILKFNIFQKYQIKGAMSVFFHDSLSDNFGIEGHWNGIIIKIKLIRKICDIHRRNRDITIFISF